MQDFVNQNKKMNLILGVVGRFYLHKYSQKSWELYNVIEIFKNIFLLPLLFKSKTVF